MIAEFKAQAALEDAAGPDVLLPTPYMHGIDSEVGQARLQLGFCKYAIMLLSATLIYAFLSFHAILLRSRQLVY